MKTNDELRQDVMDEIKWDPELRQVATEISVTAKDGVITLAGVLDSYSKKTAAERAAQRVLGVKVVATDIEIKTRSNGKITDTEIAEAARNALRWNSAVNDDQIEIMVDNGWVYLDGKVNWGYEKMAVQNYVESLMGVKGITNRIEINTKAIEAIEIKNKIAAAFHRNAALDAQSVSVEADATNITLRGMVSSWAEKEEAERIAWSSPGVLSVDNKIELSEDIFS